jgi:hypothetical protein
MDELTRATIEFACEGDKGDGEGKSSAWDIGEGGGVWGGGGCGCGGFSGLSASAPEAPTGVEPGGGRGLGNRGRQQGR